MAVDTFVDFVPGPKERKELKNRPPNSPDPWSPPPVPHDSKDRGSGLQRSLLMPRPIGARSDQRLGLRGSDLFVPQCSLFTSPFSPLNVVAEQKQTEPKEPSRRSWYWTLPFDYQCTDTETAGGTRGLLNLLKYTRPDIFLTIRRLDWEAKVRDVHIQRETEEIIRLMMKRPD